MLGQLVYVSNKYQDRPQWGKGNASKENTLDGCAQTITHRQDASNQLPSRLIEINVSHQRHRVSAGLFFYAQEMPDNRESKEGKSPFPYIWLILSLFKPDVCLKSGKINQDCLMSIYFFCQGLRKCVFTVVVVVVTYKLLCIFLKQYHICPNSYWFCVLFIYLNVYKDKASQRKRQSVSNQMSRFHHRRTETEPMTTSEFLQRHYLELRFRLWTLSQPPSIRSLNVQWSPVDCVPSCLLKDF